MNLEAGWSVAQDFKEDERGVCEQHSRAEKLDAQFLPGAGQGGFELVHQGDGIAAGEVQMDGHREAICSAGTLSF